ncbi:MAG TPA: hypothetical protein PKC98_05395 [Candidatus Melainabacteria bacterium]|nr:hypothetical protein [Candidatus Melainabacteria bacterium]
MTYRLPVTVLFSAIFMLAGGSVSAAQSSVDDSSLGSAESLVRKSGENADGRELLKSIEKTFEKAGSYIYSSDLVTYKKGKQIKESGKFYYKDPNLIRFEVDEGGKNGGSVVVRQSDGQIRGKSGGLLGKLVVSLSPNSKLLLSANGFNILKSDFETLISSTLKQLGAGKKCLVSSKALSISGCGKSKVIEIVNADDESGSVEQRIIVDASTKLPRRWLLFRDSKLLSITADMFTLGKGEMLAQAKAVGAFRATPGNITYDGKQLQDAVLDSAMLKDMSKLIAALRRSSTYLGEVHGSQVKPGTAIDDVKVDVSETDRQGLFVTATQMEIMVDNLRAVGTKLDKLSGRWDSFLDRVEEALGTIYDELGKEKVDSLKIYRQSIKIEQETRRLDNVIFGAEKQI